MEEADRRRRKKAREGGSKAGERTRRQSRIKEGAGAGDPEKDEAKKKLELKKEQK